MAGDGETQTTAIGQKAAQLVLATAYWGKAATQLEIAEITLAFNRELIDLNKHEREGD